MIMKMCSLSRFSALHVAAGSAYASGFAGGTGAIFAGNLSFSFHCSLSMSGRVRKKSFLHSPLVFEQTLSQFLLGWSALWLFCLSVS